jgi:multidrug efflux pump subunit AcrA (membrane-fusion protein)
MKKYISVILVIFVISSCNHQGSENQIKPKKSNITESVYGSVKITPEVYYNSQPLRSGIIDSIFIKEGELVKKDQILFQIAPTISVNVQLENAEINLSEAKSNYIGSNNLLKNIQLEIKTLEENLLQDSINFNREERLLTSNVGTQANYELVKLKYDNTKIQLELAKQKFQQSKSNLGNVYKKALNQIKTEKDVITDLNIRSKMDGKIYSILKEEGDFISTQEKFAEIGSHDQFIIEMDIDEVDITKIKLGDSVLISLDAYANEVFLAIVSKIYPKKDNLSQTFRVESVFVKQPKKLYYGLAGEANIIVSRRKNTLVIPAEFLLPNNRVMTLEGEKNVTVGMKNLEFVEILSGIDSTTTLIKP